ncbi:MAG TPA: hypothetical protein DEA26_08245 [Oceanospirillales bacterium]|nr:hypothetical protein [Oceanospirillaceae bacterium]HBS42657.1 hypothetical protein [Oceanospirillales bacterium]|tara:strand:+ start:2353 stop:2589 length:237 start_codon:yes stop_codon:yes gene_type:complete
MNHDFSSHYRLKALLFGGVFGACVGAVIGSLTGYSLESAATGLIGGWLVGELVTFGSALRTTTGIQPDSAQEAGDHQK